MAELKLRNKLHYRQAKTSVLAALLLGLALSLFLISHDFQKEIKQIGERVEEVLKTVKSPAARAAYGLHRDLAATVTDGLLEYQPIHRAVLYDDFGGILAEHDRPLHHGRLRRISDILMGKSTSYAIPLYVDDGGRLVGKVEVYVDNCLVTNAFLVRSLRTILGAFSLSLALSIILSVQFYFFLTKPLLVTEKSIASMLPDRQKTKISIPQGHHRDELGQLVNAFNDLLVRFHGSEEVLRKHRDNLEEMVEERTFRLKEEIVERKKAEKQIASSLGEKEVLLREIHHRVKNNMQIISSLLNLQAGYVKGDTDLTVFRECQNRINAIASIHEKLYRSGNLADICFGEYVENFVRGLFISYGVNPAGIKLVVEMGDIALGIEPAMPCGLIINELVSNSLKYAFPDGREGEIRIFLQTTGKGAFELTVSDNGIGLPEGVDFKKTESLGLHLVNILTEGQLDGEIELDRSHGASFHIRFRQ